MKKSSFVQQKRKEINSAIEFTIEQHLSVLNSEIILPTKQGRVNDLRLLATVTSRDNVYNNVVAFLDNPEIDPIVKEKSKGEILNPSSYSKIISSIHTSTFLSKLFINHKKSSFF